MSKAKAEALRRRIAANVKAVQAMPDAPDVAGDPTPGLVAAANASTFVEGNFSEPLTTYATGFRDPEDIEAALEFFAPRVPAPRRFEYMQFNNAEEFYSDSDLDDDLRAIGADFKKVEYTSEKVLGKTENRGLRIVVDLDQVDDSVNWRQMYTGKLIRRSARNDLRRAFALLSAAAVNQAKVWDTSAGKDPDQDVMAALVLAANTSGIRPNRVGYGDTAASLRSTAHRAQDSAGGFASATLTQEQLAGILRVQQVLFCGARYQSTATAKAEIVGNLVFMFTAFAGMDTEDASNIKRFVTTPEGSVGDYKVYERMITSKLVEIAVERYNKIVIPFTGGIRKLTVTDS